MSDFNKIDCQVLSFSPELSHNRISKAEFAFGNKMLKRIICFCLYILGVRRIEIAKAINLPENTVRTMLKTISVDGFEAFFDRRKKQENRMKPFPDTSVKSKGIQITELQDCFLISINGLDISVSKKNKQQLKAILLTFTENGLLAKAHTGMLLNISPSHVGHLLKSLTQSDLLFLTDKRRGQQQDLVFTPEIKSELILQYTTNAVSGKSTSGAVLASDLKERTEHDLSERSIRMWLSKLGLKDMDKKLMSMVEKKTMGNNKDSNR